MVSVGIIMGSTSDYEVMKDACSMLDEFGVEYEKKVVSAHRTPDLMYEYAKSAEERGIKVIIAGAGGAAHLPRRPDAHRRHRLSCQNGDVQRHAGTLGGIHRKGIPLEPGRIERRTRRGVCGTFPDYGTALAQTLGPACR